MNLNRISVIATNVFREMVRDRILYILGFYIFILATAFLLLPEVSGSADDKMFLDLGLAAMAVLGLVVAVFIGTGLVNKEIEKRTLLVFIAKPVSRSEFLIGKYLGLVGILTSLVAVMTVVYLIFLQVGNINYQAASIFISAIFLILQLCLISAVAITFGMISNSLLATPLTIAVYFIGNLTQDILKFGRLSNNPDFERLAQGLYLVLPDLSRLDLKNDAVYGLQALPDFTTLLGNGLYGIFYSFMLIAIAVLIFSQREF
ncbi:ABC transporter permease [Calothrix rhizosoleniae]|uniref:ABC transporter permease n=1 Tax=Calothrix rhizosoleniae TaxID=888997 RepID=UPI000B49FD4F|nr:ABC transporter permease [Calothrix rhizosoleniae]